MIIQITLELSPAAAAGLKRYAEKVSHEDARSVLYRHVAESIRAEQAYKIIEAFAALDRALAEAKVVSWPWIETGKI